MAVPNGHSPPVHPLLTISIGRTRRRRTERSAQTDAGALLPTPGAPRRRHAPRRPPAIVRLRDWLCAGPPRRLAPTPARERTRLEVEAFRRAAARCRICDSRSRAARGGGRQGQDEVAVRA